MPPLTVVVLAASTDADATVHVVVGAPRDAGRNRSVGVPDDAFADDVMRTGEMGGDDVVVANVVVVVAAAVVVIINDADVPHIGVAELVDVEFE